MINDPRSATIQRRIDVDLFVVSLNRLHAVARLAAEVADPRNVLPAALDLAVLAILSRSAWTVRSVQPTVASRQASGGGDIALEEYSAG